MIYFGFDEVVYGWSRYFDLCNAFEVRNAASPQDDPSIATLNKWRVDSPRGFAWIVHTDREVERLLLEAFEAGRTTLGTELDAALERTEQRAHALAAKAIILETGPDLPPSDTSRALIRALGERLRAHTKRVLLWESSGLWTHEDAGVVARDAGFTHVVDPFLLDAEGERFGGGPVAAFRITERAAARRQFDSWEIEQLVEWARTSERAFILLAGRFKIPHAKELALQTGEPGDESSFAD